VLPCAGKVPLVGHGVHDASTDPEQINHWWSRWPRANVGIRTGVIVDVVDIDSTEGFDQLAAREGKRTLEWWGPIAKTAKGCHCYLLSGDKPRRNRVRILPGVDYRGAGGYVIAPPSRHPSGHRYRWLHNEDPDSSPPLPAPPWLIDVLQPPPPPRRQWTPPATRLRGVQYALAALRAEAGIVAKAPEGTRNDTLNRAAFRMRRFTEEGILEEAWVTDALAEAAQTAGLGLGEALGTIASGLGGGR